MRGKIVERAPTGVPMAPRIRTARGFPVPKDRFTRHFGSRRAAAAAAAVAAAEPEAAAAAATAATPTAGDVLQDDAQREGKSMFNRMTEEEKTEAAEEARGMLRPDIIAMLRRRKEPKGASTKRGGGGVHPSAAAQRVRFVPPPPQQQQQQAHHPSAAASAATDFTRHGRSTGLSAAAKANEADSAELLRRMATLTSEGQLHALAEEMLPASEREKLRWITGAAAMGGGELRAAAADEQLLVPPPLHSAPRVDLRGNVVGTGSSTAAADPRDASLHHHGDEPERPGYTEGELLTLAGSAVAAQRAMALTAIAPVLRRRHTWERCLSIDGADGGDDAAAKGNVLARPAVAVVCAALAASAANAHLTSLCAALGALHALFCASSAPADRRPRYDARVRLTMTYRGYEQLAPTRHEMRAVRAFTRCRGVAAVRQALSQLRGADGDVIDSKRYSILCLDVLLRVARTCRSGAAAIVADERLLELLLRGFVQTPPLGAMSEEEAATVSAARFGAPSPIAFAIVRALCCASQSNVLAMEARGVFRSMFAVLAVKSPSATLRRLQQEALLTWRSCLAYELRSDSSAGVAAFLWIFPAVQDWRTRPVPVQTALCLALEALCHACSTKRSPPDVARRGGSGPSLASERAVVTDRLRALVGPFAEAAIARLAAVAGSHDDDDAEGHITAAAHFVASVYELHARGNALSAIRTTAALDPAPSIAFANALVKSALLRCSTTKLSGAVAEKMQSPQDGNVVVTTVAAAADLALATARLVRWSGLGVSPGSGVDANVNEFLASLRPIIGGNLTRFIVTAPLSLHAADSGADSAAAAAMSTAAAVQRTAARLLSFMQTEVITLFNTLERASPSSAAALSLSIVDVSAPMFGMGEEADAREWISNVLTVQRIGRTAAPGAANAIALRRLLIDFYADGALACTSEHLAAESSAKLQRCDAAKCPESLHVVLDEISWLATSERAAAGSAGAAAAARAGKNRVPTVTFESGELGPLLPRGWLLLPLRAAVEKKGDGDDGAPMMIVGPDGEPMEAPVSVLSADRLQRVEATRVASLRLLHGAEIERSAAAASTREKGHPAETALSLLYLALCPSSVLFAAPIIAHLDPLMRLLAARDPDAIVRGAARIGCVFSARRLSFS